MRRYPIGIALLWETYNDIHCWLVWQRHTGRGVLTTLSLSPGATRRRTRADAERTSHESCRQRSPHSWTACTLLGGYEWNLAALLRSRPLGDPLLQPRLVQRLEHRIERRADR